MKWTKEKDDIVEKYYPLNDWRNLFDLLGIHNKSIIYNRAKKLKISANYEWTDTELSLLEEVYPKYTNKYLSEKFFIGKAPHSIRTMALRHGLHKSIEKSVKWYDKEKMIDDLRKVSEKINRTPKCNELVLNLPSSKTYERYFGGYQKACVLAGLETNSNMFGRSIHCVSDGGDLCFSQSEKTITNFFINNKIKYEKDIFYDKEKYGNKTVDWILNDGTYVEYFGLPEKESYQKIMEEKRIICRDCNIILIELYRKDLKKLHIIFKEYINKNP